jgi:hypothetical protein
MARLEQKAMDEYRRLHGKEITVRRVDGYIGDTDATGSFKGPFRVRVVWTDPASVKHWTDEGSRCAWLDPYFDVEVISGPRTDIRSAWIYGTSRSCGVCKKRRERSDIIEAVQDLERRR